MTNPAIPALLKKRIELARRIDACQAECVTLLASLSAIDASLRLFDPEIELAEITMKPLPPRNQAAVGQMSIHVLNILRQATAPMLTEDIRDQVMTQRGLTLSDKPLRRLMLARVHSCLRSHRRRGVVASQKTKDNKHSTWETVR